MYILPRRTERKKTNQDRKEDRGGGKIGKAWHLLLHCEKSGFCFSLQWEASAGSVSEERSDQFHSRRIIQASGGGMDWRLKARTEQAAAVWASAEGDPDHESARGHGEKRVDAEILRV